MVTQLSISVSGQGLHDITRHIDRVVSESTVDAGICNIFIQHTSASLMVQENGDPAARQDLENWLSRLVIENDPLYTHVLEGPDDMPSHIKAALTATTLSIPIIKGKVALGTWQGIYIWEHRRKVGTRQLVIHLGL